MTPTHPSLRTAALAALATLAAACTTSPGPDPSPVKPNPPKHTAGTESGDPDAPPERLSPLAVTEASASSFAGFDSSALLAAATRYPTAELATDVAPPMSLTASDGTGLRLVALDARAVIEGPLAFTELHLSFQNPRPNTIEGRFAITLPEGAAISRLAMRLPSGWQEAEVVERQAARRTYEDFLHRRQDPALLEKEAGNEFRARIFPIAGNERKDIIISYSQNLIGDQAVYRLPLRGLPAVDELKVSALVGGRKGEGLAFKPATMSLQQQAPQRDFEVVPPPAAQRPRGLRYGAQLVARVAPEVATAEQRLDNVVLLFDTSASRAPGFAGAVDDFGRLVAELADLHGDGLRVRVAAFDQSVTPLYEGPATGFGGKQLDALRARRPLGASDLHAALSWAGAQGGRIVVLSDGIATTGPSEAGELRATARAMGDAVPRIDMILAGGIRDRAMAERLVRGTRAHDGVVLDAESPAKTLAERLSQTTVSGIEVAVPGAAWVWPHTLDGVQPGDELLVFAQLDSAGALAASKPMQVQLSGPVAGGAQTVSVPLSSVPGPLLERAVAQARIELLTAQRDTLDDAPGAAAERVRLHNEIVAVSTEHRVLSDATALLVLETEQDYARYGIDRKALSNILSVGPRGLEMLQRGGPVVLAQPATQKAKKDARMDANKGSRGGLELATEGNAQGEGGAPADDGALMQGDPAEREFDSEAIGGTPGGAVPAAEPAPAAEMAAGGTGSGGGGDGYGRLAEARDEAPRMADDADEAEEASAVPPPPPSRPAPRRSRRASSASAAAPSMDRSRNEAPAQLAQAPADKKPSAPALTGKLAEVMALLDRGELDSAVTLALRWQSEEPGDVLALVALGETLEAAKRPALAARAYGSLIDLFPSRADMRRFAGERLDRLSSHGADLAADTYEKAVAQRPDHLTGHRLLAMALLRQGNYAAAFDAALAGLAREYPENRFRGGKRILREDLGLIAAAWLAAEPGESKTVEGRLRSAGAELATQPSTRFVLTWETDANDVDFHIHDAKGGHAYYSSPELPSGGALYADVTTGYGPECFTIPGKAQAGPYRLQLHYYSRGPMGYGMGKLEILKHDGKGGLSFEQRPFVVMLDGAYVDIGEVHP
ncbi:VIT domain-containing protein [Haliangium ochraceum]|uniref:VIT domain-containing protein n=1 Tax=Haliangium ochraceum (strain DSM 14365 / JCM 11303 / SMP-2) TaxID=502025 RepID=D0LSG7_HALO1|nr:VIT domain-containing protein [Haliangium ochraceum]ACY15666.1 conserved hypothetical protein [Haliangium ochraceum DSM 14365]